MTDPKEARGANPWDDEIYTANGVEYITLYPITTETSGNEDDD